MKTINIAIDGPSGAGKSSLAKKIAKHYGYIYVDTGALYRSIGFYILRKGINPTDIKKVSEEIKDMKLGFRYENGLQRVYVNGEDVTDFIRTHEVSMAASNVSAISEVRSFLLGSQRDIAKTENVVMDGRDVGTVVLPEADIKIYLTATAEDRAKRRFDELLAAGQTCDYDETLRLIKERDYNDMTRKISPLKKAEDAVVLDNSGFEPEETLNMALNIISDKLGEKI